MLPVTDRFLAAIRETHAVSVRARVYRPSAPDAPIEVPVVGGSVTIDRDARVRRQGTLDLAFALTDAVARDVVRELPYGGQAVVERGVQFADGTSERVQLGRFRVEAIVWQELRGLATLTLADRMAQVQDEPFLSPYVPAGMIPSDAAVEAVRQVFGDAVGYHVLTDPGLETPLVDVAYEDDRASAISNLASSVGAEAFFDNLGDFVIRPRDSESEAAWTVDAGDRGALLDASETLDRSSVRNGVVVRGQADAETAPFYALATLDDPDSPVRWGGPFGKVAMISQSTAVTTIEQAEAAAASLLNLRLGLARTLAISTIPNPALEPDDLIEIVFSDGRREEQAVNAVQLALDPLGALQITTTSRRADFDLEPTALRVYQGAAAWRELDGARLVPA